MSTDVAERNFKPGLWYGPKELCSPATKCDWCGCDDSPCTRFTVQGLRNQTENVCAECEKLARRISIGSFRINPKHKALIAKARLQRKNRT